MHMQKIPHISSTDSLSTEQMLNLSNAPIAFDESLRKFNEISSSRHMKLNILMRNQINDTRINDSLDNHSPLCNNIF